MGETAKLRCRHWPVAAALAVLAAAVLAMLAATGGHPTYTMDDAWIHLQFSEQLARGHFGLVPGEKSSPSSSILYPLLLMPLSGTALHQWQPALWNLAGFCAVALLWQRLFGIFVFEDIDAKARELAAGLLTLAAVLCTGMVWLASTGMEHALQVAAALGVAVGLIELLQRRQARWWLLAGLVAGPLLRLENFALTLPAIAVLALDGRWRLALAALLGSVGGVVAWGVLSQSAGLPFLGGPILLKSAIGQFETNAAATLQAGIVEFARSLRSGRADSGNMVLMALLAIVLLWRGQDRVGRSLAMIALLGLLAQMALGGSRGITRYEVYCQSFALAALAFAARGPLRGVLDRLGAWRLGLAGALLLTALFPAALVWTLSTPLAAQDIWRQHWQLRRFVLDHVRAPVAVNDVGLIAYRNPHFVLDLVGLGSEEVRRQRLEGRDDRAATAALLTRHGIEAVLVYDAWVGPRLPPGLRRIAVFELGRFPVGVGGSHVTLHAANEQAAARLKRAAIEFAPGMPAGSRLAILP